MVSSGGWQLDDSGLLQVKAHRLQTSFSYFCFLLNISKSSASSPEGFVMRIIIYNMYNNMCPQPVSRLPRNEKNGGKKQALLPLLLLLPSENVC